MWSDNSNTYDLDSNRRCMCHTSYCHTATVPSLCTGCHASLYTSYPMNQWYSNVLPNSNSTSLLNYQSAPQNPISGFSHVTNPVNPTFHLENDQEVNEQMATNEVDSWLLLNPDYGEDQNNGNCSSWGGNQYPGQFNQLHIQSSQQVNYHGNYGMVPVQTSQGIQYDFSRAAFNNTPASIYNASLPSTGAGIVPEITTGSFSNTVDFPQEWGLNQFSLLPFYPGNLKEEAVGSHSNKTSISSEGTQPLISRDYLKNSSKFPLMSRQERVLRYFEKKKSRKYEKKIQYSSRKTYAQTRPRIRGRFARSSQTDTKTVV